MHNFLTEYLRATASENESFLSFKTDDKGN